jgi:hypothetical protein
MGNAKQVVDDDRANASLNGQEAIRGVPALLLEHRWAIGLRDTAAEQGAYPVDDGWIGRDTLKAVELIPPDS